MLPRTQLFAAPSEKAITIASAKEHLGVFHEEDDGLIEFLCSAALGYTEGVLARRLITQTWRAFWDAFPCGRELVLPYPRLQTVTHLKYYDEDDVATTVSAADYVVDAISEPGRLALKRDASWPSAVDFREVNAVEVQFVCGYGDTEDSIPFEIRAAMLLLVGHLYEHKEEVVIGNTASVESRLLEMGARALMAQHRMPIWSAA